jgi:uncharacterized protein YndB with AHSA1/START domain
MGYPYTYEGPRYSVTVTRRFEASSERVFDAWVNPETASQWLFATKTIRTVCAFDPRVGGQWTVTRRRDGVDYVALGEYLEFDRPRRLVFTFGIPQLAADYDTVTVEIEPDGDGCVLTLTHAGLRPGFEKATINGWARMLNRVAGLLTPGAKKRERTRRA